MRRRTTINRAYVITFGLFLVLAALVYGLGSALGPLVIAFIFSYLTYPLISKLEKKGLSRAWALSGLLVGATLITFVLLASVGPKLVEDFQSFISQSPKILERTLAKAEALFAKAGYSLDLSKNQLKDLVLSKAQNLPTEVLASIGKSLQTAAGSLAEPILWLLNLFLIPMFYVYLVMDFEKVQRGLSELVPMGWRPKLGRYFKISNTVLNGYLRGQILVACALALLYSFGLSLVGLKFGLLIGLLSGLLSLIPYVGFFIGFSLALAVAISESVGMNTFIGIIAVFSVVQALEGFVITPKLVGNKVGLSAFATVLALIIGGNLFGLLGMFLAIPMAAVLKSLLRELIYEYKRLPFYTGTPSE